MAEMPPLPQPPAYRDDGALSRSELMPFRSRNIKLWKSRALIPLAATALVCVLLFGLQNSISTKQDVLNYLNVLAIFIVFVIFLGLYVYAGERKNMLWYLVPALITGVQLSFLLAPYFFVFRKVLPGNTDATGFAGAFWGMLFGAGLMEELLKAVPALLALVVALVLRSKNSTGGFLGRGLALEGPVDGLLIGAAAGAAFILFETLLQYVPGEMARVAKEQNGNVALGVLQGVLLLFPRVLNGVIGHMAWAGISGYFIGLAVSHRRALPKLLLIGWLVPALLHAFWNSSWWLLGSWGTYVSGALSLFVFLSCLLKAKQLEVSRLGGSVDGHSILAVTPPPAYAGAGPAGVVPPALSGLAGIFTGAATLLDRLIAFRARTTVPSPAAVAAAPPPLPASGLSIGTAATRYALAPNQAIDFSALFGPAGVPAGYAGVIAAAPGGGLDITNSGTATWATSGADGATSSVPPGSALRAAAGTRLQLGSATIDIQSF